VSVRHPPQSRQISDLQLAILGVEPLCIAVRPQFPAKTLAELTALVKANPNKFNYVDSAPSVQLALEMYKMQAGNLQIVGVPYRGFAPALQDMISGNVQVMPAIFGSVTSYHEQGVLRILAVFSEERLANFPDIPTARESGLHDLVLWTFSLLCTTAGTPKPILDRLFEATSRVISDSRFVETLRSRGIELVANSNPESATQFVREQFDRLVPLIQSFRKKG
jgi:tripartite-type tricarboxylate transporter receptor subunit TctC